jgi:hypothetical protein
MTAVDTSRGNAGIPMQSHGTRLIPVFALGMALSIFFVFSYALCIIGYLVYPGLPINHAALSIFLPGFELLTWLTFCIGLVESFVYGWYVALIFGPLYNFFVTRWR